MGGADSKPTVYACVEPDAISTLAMVRRHKSVTEKEKEALEAEKLRREEGGGSLRLWQRLRGFGVRKAAILKRVLMPDVDDPSESIGFQPKAMRVHVLYESDEVPRVVNDLLDLVVERALSTAQANDLRTKTQPAVAAAATTTPADPPPLWSDSEEITYDPDMLDHVYRVTVDTTKDDFVAVERPTNKGQWRILRIKLPRPPHVWCGVSVPMARQSGRARWRQT